MNEVYSRKSQYFVIVEWIIIQEKCSFSKHLTKRAEEVLTLLRNEGIIAVAKRIAEASKIRAKHFQF